MAPMVKKDGQDTEVLHTSDIANNITLPILQTISEVCSHGYLPTVEEILVGVPDPYALPGGGPCSESNAY